MRKFSISMLVLLITAAFVVITPAFSFEAAGESSYQSVAKGCCPSSKAEAKKSACDECKDCCDECKDNQCYKDGKCECTNEDCNCPCKDSGCQKSRSSCPKSKSSCPKA